MTEITEIMQYSLRPGRPLEDSLTDFLPSFVCLDVMLRSVALASMLAAVSHGSVCGGLTGDGAGTTGHHSPSLATIVGTPLDHNQSST